MIYTVRMGIYTRRGDGGETDLFSSGDGANGASGDVRRVAKSDPRIEAIGGVDELNSWIGMVIAAGPTEETVRVLHDVQRDLFVLGADLATPTKVAVRGKDDVPRVSEKRVTEFEAMIDRYEEALPRMTAFILPGGCEVSARLHVARSVCRRAERACARLLRVEIEIVRFLNRLSDLLFVLARSENARHGDVEEIWKS